MDVVRLAMMFSFITETYICDFPYQFTLMTGALVDVLLVACEVWVWVLMFCYDFLHESFGNGLLHLESSFSFEKGWCSFQNVV